MSLAAQVTSFAPEFLQTSSGYFSPRTSNKSTPGLLSAREEPVARKLKPVALVVDDVADVTEMIAMFLQHAGFKVVTAASAVAALELARRETFDVVISDIGMPGMNGYDLAEALRELPDYDRVPMIAVTGYSMYDDRARALES